MPILTRIAGIAVLAGGLAARAPTAQRDPSTIGEANKTMVGTVAGAIGGELLGAQVGHGTGQLVAVAAGTLLGAFISHQVGESLDRADIAFARRAQDPAYAAPTGQQIIWSNPSRATPAQ
jgi:surface antigen